MPLSAGMRLGAYEILAPLGAGGMGEVWRARDARLGRDVAIKVLPASAPHEVEAVRRLELEARAASSLNHPNVLTVYDVGVQDGLTYVVCELLEGETLRELLERGPLPLRQAVDLGIQIARGLAAAHERSIVHRDLKPENVFVLREGRAKILDFGLAKRLETTRQGETVSLPSAGAGTAPGTILGTVGYMSPEQVRGEAADHRSDLFSLGCVLYEMLSGRRAFRGPSAIETLNGILKDDPPDLSSPERLVPPAAERIVRWCLAKAPADRFDSARDVALALEAASGVGTGAPALAAGPAPRARRRRLLVVSASVLVAAALALAGGYRAGYRAGLDRGRTGLRLHRLTFRRGTIDRARFAPDGQTIVYSARWDGQAFRLFSTRRESPESLPLPAPEAGLFGVSRTGELAVGLGANDSVAGTLARLPLLGGAPREVATDVPDADWAPDGTLLAVRYDAQERSQIELPVGHVLFRAEEGTWIACPRVSPDGRRVAFVAGRTGQGQRLGLVDVSGGAPRYLGEWRDIGGLAWATGSREVWLAAGEAPTGRVIQAVGLDGRVRALTGRLGGGLLLHDVAADGRALVSRNDERDGIMALAPGQAQERDLSWFDSSDPAGLSPDGRTIVFSEGGEATGGAAATYLRPTDGSPATRLGEGRPRGLSPDGRWVSTLADQGDDRLILLPTGAGQPRQLPPGPLASYQSAEWFPDSRRLLVRAREAGQPWRCWVQELDGLPQPLGSPELTYCRGVSPDGRFVGGQTADWRSFVVPVEGGSPRRLEALGDRHVPNQFSADGRSLFVVELGTLPLRVQRLDLASGALEPWKLLGPTDAAGLTVVRQPLVTPDGRYYAYGFSRVLSDLYLAEGLQ